MTRPPSIVHFERVYLGAVALGMLTSALNWSATARMIAAQHVPAAVVLWYQPLATLAGIAIPLLLCYAIARRGSAIAKWIVVLWTTLLLLELALGLASGRAIDGVSGALGLASILANVVATVLLFRPDTRAWFARTPQPDTLA